MGIQGRSPQQHVGPATDELKGYVELATPAECLEGTDNERAVTPLGLQGAVDVIGNQTVKAQFFTVISSGTTSGQISKPAGNGADVSFVMDEWGTDTDALLSTLENGKPTWVSPKTAGGVTVTTTFDTGGNFSFSGTPSPAADLALVYVYTCYLTNLNAAEVLFESELISHSHSLLSNLDADDHLQYHTDGRGDARYYKKTELNDRTAGASGSHLIGSPSIGTPTYPDLNDRLNLLGSAGRISGGAISDAGSETVNVAAGTGFIKATDSDVGELLSFDWAASNGIAVPTDTKRYIGVIYSGGSPVVDIRTTDNYDLDSEFALGSIVNEGGTLHVLNDPHWISDAITNVIERFEAEGHFIRDQKVGGLILSAPATRRIAVTAGAAWSRLNEFPISSFTSVGDAATFEAYWRNSSGVWADDNLYQYSVLQWNDITMDALQNIQANRHCNIWVYAEVDDDEISILYPQEQHLSFAAAESEAPPTVVPTHIQEHGFLLGRIIIKYNTDAPLDVQSAFAQAFVGGTANDHGNLAGLTDDDHPQYMLDADVTNEAIKWALVLGD